MTQSRPVHVVYAAPADIADAADRAAEAARIDRVRELLTAHAGDAAPREWALHGDTAPEAEALRGAIVVVLGTQAAFRCGGVLAALDRAIDAAHRWIVLQCQELDFAGTVGYTLPATSVPSGFELDTDTSWLAALSAPQESLETAPAPSAAGSVRVLLLPPQAPAGSEWTSGRLHDIRVRTGGAVRGEAGLEIVGVQEVWRAPVTAAARTALAWARRAAYIVQWALEPDATGGWRASLAVAAAGASSPSIDIRVAVQPDDTTALVRLGAAALRTLAPARVETIAAPDIAARPRFRDLPFTLEARTALHPGVEAHELRTLDQELAALAGEYNGDGEFHLMRAQVLIRLYEITQNPQLALQAAEQAELAMAEPGDHSLDARRLVLAQMRYVQGRHRDAAPLLIACMRSPETRGDAMALFAQVAAAMGRARCVERIVDTLEREHGNDWGRLRRGSLALARLGKYERALGVQRRIVELAPWSARDWVNLCGMLSHLDRDADAIAALAEGTKHGYNAMLFDGFGFHYFNTGRYAEAATKFRWATAIQPHHATYHGNYGDALKWSGQRDAARAAWTRAVENMQRHLLVNPANAQFLGYLACWYALLDRRAEALATIDRARGFWREGDGAVAAVLGRACAILGDLEAALVWYRPLRQHPAARQLLLRDPELSAVRDALDREWGEPGSAMS